MLKKIILTIVFPGTAMLFAQQGVLMVHVADKANDQALELANVLVESGGVVAGTGIADDKGNLVFKNLSPGAYDVKAIYTGYQKNKITGVMVNNNETTYLTIALSSDNIMDEFVVTEYTKPLIDPNTSIKTTFTAEDIKRSPYHGDIDATLANTGRAVQTQEGMTPHFTGGRDGSVQYIIDGQPVHGSYRLPTGAIQQMSVTLGGVPARYGDATSAFIEIETKSGLVKPKR